ncbi:hypothetical protein [Actinophytocola xanthii]|uniref:DUF5709 domain-containing protein n=1 Tax=Actinophytocola xanthii TaxID=1912961 RepID=A0A1Q8CRW7_9PSEU|nr:hypothetical protein [Actinophytocola xanthii]OLF17077.1 hypothetical protein BU204_13370 [Actinophytocola xanthii]
MPSRSEQQDGLELEPEAPVDEPEYWRAHDPDLADKPDPTLAEQVSATDDGSLLGDDEPDAVADYQGTDYPGGPENQAMRIDEEP